MSNLTAGPICWDSGELTFASQETSSPQTSVVIDLTSPSGLIEDLSFQQVTIEDPLYHQTRGYEAVRLQDLLELIPGLEGHPTEETLVVFVSADGYRATLPLDKAFEQEGYIVTHDLQAAPGQNFVPLRTKRELVDPGPYYLVWEGLPESDRVYPWSYQLVQIEVVLTKDYFAPIYPDTPTESVKDGFHLFATDCLSCHSIGEIGGSRAGDLSQSVRRWRLEDFMVAFRRQTPGKPDRSDITDIQARAIYEYLWAIAK